MSEQSKKQMTYADAGVDIDAGNRAVELMKESVRATYRPEVIGDLGGFGGLFALNSGKYEEPILVSGTDGVGTKLKLAFMADKHNTIGQDAVAMCVNDILVQGAEPLFFLDYIAVDKVDAEKVANIVQGVAKACQESGCALIGGETAEMAGFYSQGEYDIAGYVGNPTLGAYLFPRGEDWDYYKSNYEVYDGTRNINVHNWTNTAQEQFSNPYWMLNRHKPVSYRNRYEFGGSVKYDIMEGLSVTGRLRYERGDETWNLNEYASSTAGRNLLGTMKDTRVNSEQTYGDLLAQYNKTWEDTYSLSVTAGGSYHL